HTRCYRDWSSDVCSSDLVHPVGHAVPAGVSGDVVVADVLADAHGVEVDVAPGGDDVDVPHGVGQLAAGAGLVVRQVRGGEPGGQIGRASCREGERGHEGG